VPGSDAPSDSLADGMPHSLSSSLWPRTAVLVTSNLPLTTRKHLCCVVLCSVSVSVRGSVTRAAFACTDAQWRYPARATDIHLMTT
jgi:hypothetical protein